MALREVHRGMPKAAGKLLGAARAWYLCMEETR